MKKLFNFIVEKWYLVFIFSLVFNCSAILISYENLPGLISIYFIVDILILLLLLVSFGYHLSIKKWLKAILIFLSSIAHSFISYWIFIGMIFIIMVKSCEENSYEKKVIIDLNKNDSICPVIRDSLLDEDDEYLEIGIIEDSVYGLYPRLFNKIKLKSDIPLCVGVYKLEDGRILTVEKKGLIASIKKDTLVLENK